MITIKSKQEGFRRCGVAHSVEAKSYPDDRFTEEELLILKSEPMLIVTTEENDSSRSTGFKAREAIAAIKEVQTVEALEAFIQGETRASVLTAIETRRKELEA
jgi:hypothetical protein